MIELTRHIESLLLKHDCVIVPGLGGFVTQYVPARRVEGEQLLLPPCRSVAFNPQLTLNDGLLVQSYMQAYDTGYAETLRLIGEAVEQLKHTLRDAGKYELPGIGQLSLAMGGRYDFVPCEAGVISPDLYGLDALTISEIKQNGIEERPDNNDTEQHNIHLGHNKHSYTISISRELVNYVAAAAVAVIFYFLWITPVNNSTPENQQAAAMVYKQIFDQPQTTAQAKSQARPSANVPQKEGAAVSPSKPEAPAASQEEEAAAKSEGKYTIVLASSITMHNARAYADELVAKGFKDAAPYKRGRMVRVVYGHYPTQREAQNVLMKLRSNKPFADAWVMEQ